MNRIRITGLQYGKTLRLRSGPGTDTATEGKTWNDAEFDVIDEAQDSQGRTWYNVGAWVASWYTKPAHSSPYLTANLPTDTRWAVLKTDNYNGNPCPRMNQPHWTWGGGNPASTYPETVVLRDPDGWKYAARAIPEPIMDYVINLNHYNNDNAVDILLNPGSGWINKVHPEFLLTGGSWVVVLEETTSDIRIQTLPWDWIPEDPTVFNHRTAHPFINHFIAIHEDGYRVDISSGGNGHAESILTPNLCPGEAWIEKTDKWATVRVWFPPEVPFIVECQSNMLIRETPGGKIIGSAPSGSLVNIAQYYPTDDGVWGSVDNCTVECGWLNLQHLSYPGDKIADYFTTWYPPDMTPPPPRPTYWY